ncbi:MAG: hypothetical protein IPG73_03015 [Ignavibacteria bacterium]|nr:hypothetical protein [Ignavibacteria bacterium]MBK7033143.1 hypothetical protein [Ignavibacteria bacterium]
MMHRLILMLSGLLMMFAIFGLVMWIGAEVGENDEAATGNMILCLIMTTLTLAALKTGLWMRSRMNKRMEEVITSLVAREGHIDATSFAAEMKISMDDARDVLDKRARKRNWKRAELEHYNARYFPL